MRNSFFTRYSLLILMAFFFAAPLLMQGAHRALRSNENKVIDWLPKTFTETQELGWFRDHFVADQFVMVSWPGCELGDNPELPDAEPDDPRIERLAQLLEPDERMIARNPRAAERAEFFQSVTTARRVLNDITSPPSEVPYSEAVRRLMGTLIGPDGRQTAVVVMLSDAAIEDFRSVVGRHVPTGVLPWQHQPGVLIEALAEAGIDPETARLGGPPVENVAIDEEGERTFMRLATFSGLLGLGLAWWSLRSIKLTLMVFACAIMSAAAGLALIFWTGSNTDAVIMAMPSLLYVLAISGGIHYVNYYRDAIGEHGMESAPERALSHSWKPQLLCNVTTGIGLASLGLSDLTPISKFGLYSAAGMMMTLVFLFLFLPAALAMWPVPLSRKQRREKHLANAAAAANTNGHPILVDNWTRLGSWVIRNNAVVAAASFAIIITMALGLTRIHTNIDLLKLFDDTVRVRQDYAWLEQNVGRLVPLEVVVEFPPEKQRAADEIVDAADAATRLSFLERLELVALVQQKIDQELGPAGRNLVGPSLSPVTFAPPVPPAREFARRVVTNVRLEESEDALKRSGYLQTDQRRDTELWRISLRAAAFAGLDYGQFVNSVRAVIEPVLAAERVREQVLQQVVASRADGSIAGGNVCLWQRGEPRADQVNKTAVEDPAYQQHVLSGALEELLYRARLNLAAVDGDELDLAALTDQEREQMLEGFQAFDSVVAMGRIRDDELRMLRQAGVRVVDARDTVPPLTDEPLPVHGDAIAAVYTGVVPIVYKAQRALLNNLIKSSFWSFVTITPLLMLLCRSVLGGSVAMIPNIFPVLVIFGGMGWLGIFVDIGSMMAASIALGVAVDDTIHYLGRFRHGMARLGDRHRAILFACRRAGPPTLQAGLINGIALSVFTLSSFTPTQRLGWLMMTILLAGMTAQLLITPALLAGPLGRAFKFPRQPAAPTVPPPHAAKRQTELEAAAKR